MERPAESTSARSSPCDPPSLANVGRRAMITVDALDESTGVVGGRVRPIGTVLLALAIAAASGAWCAVRWSVRLQRKRFHWFTVLRGDNRDRRKPHKDTADL